MLSQLLSKLPAPRPADFGLNVTVCIAFFCEGGKNIVTVSDQRASFGEFSSDNAVLKNARLAPNWVAMYAGNDVDHAEPILRVARGLVSAYRNDLKRNPSPLEIAELLDHAYSTHLRAHLTRKFLRKHGYTFESFRKLGRRQCTPEVYARTWEKIERGKLSLTFLLCGFEPLDTGHIFVVDGEGSPTCANVIGYWAIGSGGPAAMNAISFHATRLYGPRSTLANGAYVAITAKFMAESATDVGLGTFVHVLTPDHKTGLFVRPWDYIKIRKLFETRSAPRVPKAAEKLLSKLLYDPRDEMAKFLRKERESKRSGSRKSKSEQ